MPLGEDGVGWEAPAFSGVCFKLHQDAGTVWQFMELCTSDGSFSRHTLDLDIEF